MDFVEENFLIQIIAQPEDKHYQNNKNGFCRYFGQKKKRQKKKEALINKAG